MVGAAQGHLGWARPTAAEAPSSPRPCLGVGCGLGWGMDPGISCLPEGPQLACGFRTCPAPGLTFCPPLLSGLANHGQTRHMVRGWAPPHTCAHACAHIAPLGFGRRPSGTYGGAGSGLPSALRAPPPPQGFGVRCHLPGSSLVVPRVQYAAWRPQGSPLMPPLAAGTKPEPPAQWEVVPHQSAPDPGGLPAPCQAAADELDRRP